MTINDKTKDSLIKQIIEEHGTRHKLRVQRGVEQVSCFWRKEDGSMQDFKKFCKKNFISNDKLLLKNFKRIEKNIEILYGNLNRLNLDLKRPLHLDSGSILPIDMDFGKYDPFAHLEEDFYKNKIAFFILLNFASYSLDEKIKAAEKWNRREWSYARVGDLFISRIPSIINQKVSEVFTNAEAYISEYNIYMNNLVDNNGRIFFSEALKLISHWGLRDEIKACYQNPEGLVKQKMIYKVMNRIIHQDIPRNVINSPEFKWNPFKNEIFKYNKKIDFSSEPDTRYEHFLKIFKALREIDKYYPYYSTHIKRKFNIDREIPEIEVEKLFEKVLSSEQVRYTANFIKNRLNRELLPFDIWYKGFTYNKSIPETKLDKIVSEKYPNIESFEKNIKNILIKLGFSKNKAEFISSKIKVEPARGAGHAWGPEIRTDLSHLRTRVTGKGMNYKGFNTAMHELGHCVEQTLSLYYIDYYMLHGIPNTAFTEAFAFVFQARDLEILDQTNKNIDSWYYNVLNTLWSCYEIMGVSLVDMKVWNWMYKNPESEPNELKHAVIKIAKEIWNKYYSEIFNIKDQPILAIYSHMIDSALYLPDYPIGFLIKFQIEKFLKDKNLGKEMERMCVIGKVTPQLWMKKAVSQNISADPLLEETDIALEYFKNKGH